MLRDPCRWTGGIEYLISSEIFHCTVRWSRRLNASVEICMPNEYPLTSLMFCGMRKSPQQTLQEDEYMMKMMLKMSQCQRWAIVVVVKSPKNARYKKESSWKFKLKMSTCPPVPFSSLPLSKQHASTKLNAWGAYGDRDERGFLNRQTEEIVAAAASEIKTGTRVSLNAALDFQG